jgi:3-oxoacyl-[acyl-carrier protein] reductase
MDLELKDKRALVTGASRGLGFATALILAQEGARVAINSRDESALEAAAQKITGTTGAEILLLPGDVTVPGAVEELIERAAGGLDGLDILITNSGGPPAGKFEAFSDETWRQAVELSFLSHVRMIRSALPYLRRSEAPSVLTITSVSVKQPIPDLVLSNSIRAATVGLTKSLAIELGKEGIRFNSILPSWTETQRVHSLLQSRAQANGTTVEEEMAKQTRDVPLGRMGRPEEFAKTAAFLVSPAASYLNGVMLQVDGGSYKGLL